MSRIQSKIMSPADTKAAGAAARTAIAAALKESKVAASALAAHEKAVVKSAAAHEKVETPAAKAAIKRSEEHTSELQSQP